jgi:hypothetical protein
VNLARFICPFVRPDSFWTKYAVAGQYPPSPCAPTNCGFGLPRWLTFCSRVCAAFLWRLPTWLAAVAAPPRKLLKIGALVYHQRLPHQVRRGPKAGLWEGISRVRHQPSQARRRLSKYGRAVRYPQIVSIEAETRFWRFRKLRLPAKLNSCPPERSPRSNWADCEISGLGRR